MGDKFMVKKHYVTLEWPLASVDSRAAIMSFANNCGKNLEIQKNNTFVSFITPKHLTEA